MKVIDLLNKIANSGVYEKETHFKYYDRNAEEYDISLLLYEVIIDRLNKGQIDLNDEVEIIEEDKKIEKLVFNKGQDGDILVNGVSLIDKVNEIIDKVNKEK